MHSIHDNNHVTGVILDVQKLHIQHEQTTLLDNLSFQLHRGKTLALVGESGSGKTISCLALLGLLPPSLLRSGRVNYADIDLLQLSAQQLQSIRGHKIALIFQDPMAALNPLHQVEKIVGEALILQGLSQQFVRQRVIHLLNDVGLTQTEALLNGKTPDKLFYSLLYQRGTIDRFSWIENNNEVVYSSKIAEVEKSGGFDIGIYPKDNTNTTAVALVNYVVPNSPAALAGLKRGDVITKVNGSPLTLNNSDLLYNNQVTVTLAATVQLTSAGLITTDKTSSISITQADIDENPIAYYEKKVYGTKNIGYFVFKFRLIDYENFSIKIIAITTISQD